MARVLQMTDRSWRWIREWGHYLFPVVLKWVVFHVKDVFYVLSDMLSNRTGNLSEPRALLWSYLMLMVCRSHLLVSYLVRSIMYNWGIGFFNRGIQICFKMIRMHHHLFLRVTVWSCRHICTSTKEILRLFVRKHFKTYSTKLNRIMGPQLG